MARGQHRNREGAGCSPRWWAAKASSSPQRAIPADTSELTPLLPLLDTITATGAGPANRGSGGSECQAGEQDPPDLCGAVITADALHVHRENIEGVWQRGGEYVLTVKSNQPKLRAKLTEPFGDHDGAFPLTTSPLIADTPRCETREITCTAHVADLDTPGVFQAFRIRRVTTDLQGNPKRAETAYGISTPDHLSGQPRRHRHARPQPLAGGKSRPLRP